MVTQPGLPPIGSDISKTGHESSPRTTSKARTAADMHRFDTLRGRTTLLTELDDALALQTAADVAKGLIVKGNSNDFRKIKLAKL